MQEMTDTETDGVSSRQAESDNCYADQNGMQRDL